MDSTTSPVMATHHQMFYDSNVRQSHPKYPYPPVPALQRPPVSYMGHSRRQSEAGRLETARLQSSISSATSGSSDLSAMRQSPSQQSYRHAPSMEQGLMAEKSPYSWNSPRVNGSPYPPSRQEMTENNSAVIKYIQTQQRLDDDEEEEQDHAIWVLFWLICLDPVHSFISAIYTLLVVFTLVLVSPIRLCQKQSSIGDQIIRSLAPIYRNHLEMLKAPSIENAFSFEFKPLSLVVIHLTSPFLSIGIMLASWVSAAFWLFALILGNPDGTEKGDDGRDAVISVRNWWERYLLHAVKQ